MSPEIQDFPFSSGTSACGSSLRAVTDHDRLHALLVRLLNEVFGTVSKDPFENSRKYVTRIRLRYLGWGVRNGNSWISGPGLRYLGKGKSGFLGLEDAWKIWISRSFYLGCVQSSTTERPDSWNPSTGILPCRWHGQWKINIQQDGPITNVHGMVAIAMRSEVIPEFVIIDANTWIRIPHIQHEHNLREGELTSMILNPNLRTTEREIYI